MKTPTWRVVLAVSAFAAASGRADRATAGLITYTESSVIQGSLGQHNFDSLVTVSLTADTSGITQSAFYHYSSPVTTATVTVDGLTATFLDPVYFGAGRGTGFFTDQQYGPSSGITILDISNPAFTGYDLSTPLGPLTGEPGGFGGELATTLGTMSNKDRLDCCHASPKARPTRQSSSSQPR